MSDKYPVQIDNKPWLKQVFDELTASHAQGRLAHAPLFAGPQGLGKFALAQSLARVLLCVSPGFPKPCGQCTGCALAASDNHPDLLVISPAEGKQVVGIDAIRKLISRLGVKSHQGGYRTVLFPELTNMTFAAANSLLKVLEEPPPDTFFLCCSAHAGVLLPTIRSRLQMYRINPPSRSAALAWLRNTAQLDKLEAENFLALAQGAPLKVAAMLERDFSQQRRQVLNLFMLCHSGSGGGVMTVIRNLTACSLRDNLALIAACLFDLLHLHYNPDVDPSRLNFPDEAELLRKLLQNNGRKINPRRLFTAYDQLLTMQDACVKGIAVDQQLQLFNLAGLIGAMLRPAQKKAA